jgi:dGTPase
LNEDLAEAIALAHDLGHTPFGHAGESFLAEILQEKGCGTFVHSAQSVRILNTLEEWGRGLNLTLQVLDGVLGHNGELLHQELQPREAPSWEKLERDYKSCLMTPGADKKVYPSTLEGCVVRIADIISYVGRDIQDAIEIKLISYEDLPEGPTKILGATNRDIINNLTMDIIRQSLGQDSIRMSKEVFEALRAFMTFNYERIYLSAPIQDEKRRLRDVFRQLFNKYLEDLRQQEKASPIVEYADKFSGGYQTYTPPARIVTDFIAGMTDDYLIQQYQEQFVPRSLGYRLDADRGHSRAKGMQ